MNKILLIIAIALTALTSQAQQFDTKYYAYVDTAYAHISKENWAKAERYIRMALETEPSNPNNSLLINNMGTLQRYQKRYSDAVKSYSQALSMTPNAVNILQNRAQLYIEMDSLNSAMADFKRIAELDANDTESRYNMGMLELENGNLDAAYGKFQEIAKIDGTSDLYKTGMASWNKMTGNYAEAVMLYSESIQKEATASLLTDRAECYIKLKELNKAESDIQDAIEKDAESGYLYMLRARLYKLKFNHDFKLRDIDLAVRYGLDRTKVEKYVNM